MIPLVRPLVANQKLAEEYLTQSRRRGVYSNFGPNHERLAARLKRLTRALEVLPVSSGTDAIEVALRVCMSRGARVVVPDFTHIGTLSAVCRAGMKPVLAGVDDSTWTLRPSEILDAHAKGLVDGAVVVSPFGYSIDESAWREVANQGVPLVFDFAGAFGYFPRLDDPIVYSFHATKNFGVGEGGAIAFSSQDQYERARRLINFDTLPDRTIASLDGGNMKMGEIIASYLLATISMPQKDPTRSLVFERIARKLSALELYAKMIPGAYLPIGPKSPSLCVLGNLPAQALEDASEELGIVCKRYYPLLSRMPGLSSVGRLSVSSDAMTTCCALPSDVDARELAVVIETVSSFIESSRS